MLHCNLRGCNTYIFHLCNIYVEKYITHVYIINRDFYSLNPISMLQILSSKLFLYYLLDRQTENMCVTCF